MERWVPGCVISICYTFNIINAANKGIPAERKRQNNRTDNKNRRQFLRLLKTMKEQLVACVQGQLGDVSKVDTHELGEAIDMIKDLSEAIYYCTITDSM